jgi:hypothetical protein
MPGVGREAAIARNKGRDVFVLKSLGFLTLQPRTRAALGTVRSRERSAHMG